MPTPTKRSVSNIKSNLLAPALTSHFEVYFDVPTSLSNRYNTIRQGKIHLMCSEASLPGSSLATHQIDNDFHGVTERHAYRRIYDDRIDLTFYVDSRNYLPIKFFEDWISYITSEDKEAAKSNSYTYRVRYPDTYSVAGLEVTKFEKDYAQALTYQFIKSYPLQITSMPVSYDGSDLLKCSVAMTYIRYVVDTTLISESAFTGVGGTGILEQAGANDLFNTSSNTA
tara:strand:- start:282 stop:959 length:678 start_codon:yes stop_codon:yes gene_type:complete